MFKNMHLLYFFLCLFHLSFSQGIDYTQMGWPKTLADVYAQLHSKRKNYVVLISRLPTIPVDFRSEEGLKNSINSLNFQNNFHPGHEMIGWKCHIGGTPFESMIGFTGESDDQHKKLLDSGWGLSAMLATFKDGFIQSPGELENRLKYFNEENEKALASGNPKKINLIATVVEVSEDECADMINEVYVFLDHPNRPTEKFSMILSPTEYEGAGCGSFVVHFLERIGSLKPLVSLFQRQFNLPDYLFGTGAILPLDVEIPERISRVAMTKPVSKFKLIGSSWAPSTNNVSIQITDPELIVFWQKLIFESYFDQNHLEKEKKLFTKKMTRGFWEKSSDYRESEIYETRFVKIDEHFDSKTKEIVAQHSQVMKSAQLTFFTFLTFPGIILEKK